MFNLKKQPDSVRRLKTLPYRSIKLLVTSLQLNTNNLYYCTSNCNNVVKKGRVIKFTYTRFAIFISSGLFDMHIIFITLLMYQQTYKTTPNHKSFVQ